MSNCPCGSGNDLAHCCAPVLDGQATPNPQALIRARYTAYAVEKIDFLLQTMTAEVRLDLDPVEAARIAKEATWLGVEILDAPSEPNDNGEHEVEYVAKFRLEGQKRVHHERAFLRQEDGRWIVCGGTVDPKGPPARVEKVGRNDPCPCGSGKKYKKCCAA